MNCTNIFSWFLNSKILSLQQVIEQSLFLLTYNIPSIIVRSPRCSFEHPVFAERIYLHFFGKRIVFHFLCEGGRGVQHFSSPGQTGTPAQFPISCQFRWLPSTSRPFPPSPFAPPLLFFETFLFGLPFVSRKKRRYISSDAAERRRKNEFSIGSSPPPPYLPATSRTIKVYRSIWW